MHVPHLKNYDAASRDTYTQERTHTGRRKMITPGTRIVLTIVASVIFAIIGYLIVIIGLRTAATFLHNVFFQIYNGEALDLDMKFSVGLPNRVEFVLIAVWTIFWAAMFANYFKRNLDAQNAMNDRSDINEYPDDQYLATPEEIMERYAFFPDIGAHADIQVSSLVSHVMLSNKGIKQIEVSDRAAEDILDEDGEIVYRKGDILYDEDGNIIKTSMPMFDADHAKLLFSTSFVQEEYRHFFDVRKIMYNPGKKIFGKLPYETASDLINGTWTFPEYEKMRPCGAYLVDSDPVNTMIIASTRAGKGQTIIEPTIDMWTREMRPNNIVVNDPKGELLLKFYEPATIRGYDVVSFNLINAMKTDIYNPLALAAIAAREGDFTKCAAYTENIADVFFPVEGSEDPVWPNAANNAFKRAVYGLIDYYMEEETRMRNEAENDPLMSQSLLENKVDQMWGHVTLYNAYQMFVRLSSKKIQNPVVQVKAKQKENAACASEGKPPKYSNEEMADMIRDANAKGILWNQAPEVDALTLYFNALSKLPVNGIRTLAVNAHNSLLAMGGADKMIAS